MRREVNHALPPPLPCPHNRHINLLLGPLDRQSCCPFACLFLPDPSTSFRHPVCTQHHLTSPSLEHHHSLIRDINPTSLISHPISYP